MNAVVPFAYWAGSDGETVLHDFLAEWRGTFPAFRLMGDAEVVPLLTDIGDRDAALYQRIRLPAARSDVARLMHLYDRGGLYVDCHTALTDEAQLRADLALLEHHELVVWQRSFTAFPRPQEEQRPVNTVLAARPGSPIVRRILDTALEGLRQQAERELREGPGKYSVWHMTGAGLIREVLCEPDSAFLQLRPEFVGRIASASEDDGAVAFWRHQTYRKDRSQHWSERQKHEPLFDPAVRTRRSRLSRFVRGLSR